MAHLYLHQARAITNLIGNGVATVVVSRWENAIDMDRAGRVLAGGTEAAADEPERMLDGAALAKETRWPPIRRPRP